MSRLARTLGISLFISLQQLAAQSILVPNQIINIGSCDVGSVAPEDPPYETTVTIRSGAGAISFITATDPAASWLQVQPLTGTVTTTGTSLTIKAFPQRLRLGTQKGYVAVAPQSNINDAKVFTVSVTCVPTPTIFFEQSEYVATVRAGAAISSHRVRLLTNESPQSVPTDDIVRFRIDRRTPGAPYQWLASAALTNQTGDMGQIRLGASDFMNLQIDPGRLTAGDYIGYLSLRDTQAQQSSADLLIRLTVTPGPTIDVPPAPVVFSGEAGAANPPRQTIRMTSTGEPLTATVTPRPQSGSWLSVNGSTAPLTLLTPADLAIDVNTTGLVAGTYSGTIQIEPGGISISVQLVLSVSQRPVVSANGIQNGASFEGVISPGAWVTIRGENLAPDTSPNGRLWRDDEFVGGRLPTALDNVRVTIDGRSAFINFVSNTQLNVLAPSDIGTGNNVPVVVTSSRGSGSTAGAVVQSVAPAFFLFGITRNVAAQHGSDYAPAGDPVVGVGARVARPGDTILLYATGFGPAQPDRPAGALFSTASTLPQNVVVIIGGRSSSVPGYLVAPGLYQFNVVIPLDVPDGDQPVTAEYGGARTQNDVWLRIRR